MTRCQTWTEEESGLKVLVEPMINGVPFQKWNSNTGFNDPKLKNNDYIQALSHWSYHTSNGNLLLCDLQGGKKTRFPCV